MNNSINNCEQGLVPLSTEPQGYHGSSARSCLAVLLAIILFNVCLVCIGYLTIGRAYVSGKDSQNLEDWTCSLIGLSVILVVVRMEDLSEGNPNFYYI